MADKDLHPTMYRIYAQTGLNALSLADALNEQSQKVYNWDTRGISKQGALTVSTKFGIDIKWILTGEGSPEIEKIVTQNPPKNLINTEGRWVPVKAYSKMGMDGYFTDMGYGEGNGGDGYIPTLSASKDAYGIKGKGDSMYPAIRSGWYLVCDPQAPLVPAEFVQVCLKDGRCTIKEFIGINNSVLNLLAVNGGERLTFDMEDVESITAITDIVPPSRHRQEYPLMKIKDVIIEKD